MDIVLLIIRLFLFGIFTVAGIAKLLDSRGSQRSAEDFGIPESFSKVFSILLPIVELIAAFGFLFAEFSWYSAVLSLIMMLAFIGGMVNEIRQGNSPNCHCFGQLSKEPIGYKSLIRNGIFAALSIVLIVFGEKNQGASAVSWIQDLSNGERMQFVFGLLIVGLLGVAVGYLVKILNQAKDVSHQIQVLEFLSADTTQLVEREEAKTLESGLVIGSYVQNFSLPDLKGKTVDFEDLLTDGKPMMLFFVSPNCNPCRELLPEITKWETEFENKIKFVFISSGKAKENIAKFGNERTILLQKDREIALEFESPWTPTMIFVSSKGTIGSSPAVGDIAIREMISKVKMLDFSSKLAAVKTSETSLFGTEAADFELRNSSGKTTKLADLKGNETLAVFWSVTCPHCVAFLEEFREWDQTKNGNSPNLVLFSTAVGDDFKELGFRSESVTDTEWKISNKIGMEGTPSAILINADGKIASETAAGAKNIMALIGKRSEK
jgi:thiol-disulfide isomerase/thioredoxin/uncharacterized membrane protein YphA (DoxX/SURF4 family)